MPASPSAPAAAAAPRRDTVATLQPDTTITGNFLVTRKEVRQKQNGEPYLALTLADRTGQIDANLWDGVAEAQSLFERDDVVRVRALVQLYRDKLQLKIDKLRPLAPDEVVLEDYLPSTTADVAAMWTELEARIAACRNPHLRALLQAVFGDAALAERFRRAPAAKALHHAWLGGLLEHVTSLCRLAERVLPCYPFLDADLLLTGILLHDLGKIEELDYRRSFRYSTEGELLGHMILVLRIVHEKLRALPGFPPRLAAAVEHMIISHHGHYEFGSPKLPMFPEALLLHHLDDLDSKMQAMRTQFETEPALGEWTARNRSLDRSLLRLEAWLRAGVAE